MISLCKLYKKIDKNGAVYYVGDAGKEAGYMVMPIRPRGELGEPAFTLYIRSKEQRNEQLGYKRNKEGENNGND